MTACPKCGKATEPTARVCPSCGVIMAKVRLRNPDGSQAPGTVAGTIAPATPGLAPPPILSPAQPRSPPQGVPLSPTRPPSPPIAYASKTVEPASAVQAFIKVAIAVATAAAAFVVVSRMQAKPLVATPSTAFAARPAPQRVPTLPPPSAANPADAHALSQADVAFLNEMSTRLEKSAGATPTESEIDRVERLFALHPDDGQLKEVLMFLYVRRADHDLQLGSFAQVEQCLAKMKALDGQQPRVYAFETYAKSRQSDWPASLLAAQKYESLSGEATLVMSYSLALAFDRVGRKTDALSVLDRPIFQNCPSATAPLDISACRAAQEMKTALTASAPPGSDTRPRAALKVDASKEEIQSERFDIRFDGESQSGVARDVLFVLDRAYVRLADIYYDRPRRKIPVVLHSSEDYFTKTGAPWWSGGVYSSHDGAIQIPIRGIPNTLPREMENVLVHELSHAFVDEMSGGFAGKDIQEGLAQYMEGKRIEQELGLPELKRLANSGKQTVMSFYMLSLAVSQQLVQSRGQGMVNQLLQAMKEARSEDGGFQKTFGQSGAAMKKDILETFWRRYS